MTGPEVQNVIGALRKGGIAIVEVHNHSLTDNPRLFYLHYWAVQDGVTLAIGPGSEQRVARSEISELQPGAISLMPQGFDQALTRQELADLIAFLKACVPKGH